MFIDRAYDTQQNIEKMTLQKLIWDKKISPDLSHTNYHFFHASGQFFYA